MLKRISSLIPRKLKDRILTFQSEMRRDRIVREWEEKGRPLPPPHVIKQQMINKFRHKTGAKVFVETGTFAGDMVFAQKDNFGTIYSIELSPKLWEIASKRFKVYNHINIIQGDSGKVLKELTPKLDQKVLFWLDGHYSGGETARGDTECPIYAELDAIFLHNHNHVILVDDAGDFNGTGDYPTVDAVVAYVKGKNPKYRSSVENNIIALWAEE